MFVLAISKCKMFSYNEYILMGEMLVVIAGSLESANSSILAARRHFKEVVGEKSDFMLMRLL